MPAAMISFSFSKRGHSMRLPLMTSTSSRARMGTSTALPATSPSPIAARGANADAAEKGMQGKFHFEVGVQRLKRCGVLLAVDGIKPQFLRQRLRFQHRRVMRSVGGAKSRRERAHALVAVHLQIENVHDEGVARLRAFDEKRSGERIVAFYEGERIAGLLQRIA